MKTPVFPISILREVFIRGTRYSPGDTAQVSAEMRRELVAICVAEPKDKPLSNFGKSARGRY